MLSKHPKVKLKIYVLLKTLEKKYFFDKRIKKKITKNFIYKKINWNELDLVFLSLPNGEAQKILKKNYLKNKNLKFIDLSADFRIRNYKIYEKNYKIKHNAKDLIKNSLYSIPEFNKNKI